MYNKQHLITLLGYIGIGFISGSISHGVFSGTRSLITAVIGIILFLISEFLKEGEKDYKHLLIGGLIFSMAVGLVSGGFQHFLDSPTRSLWIIPLGWAVSTIIYPFKEGLANYQRGKSTTLGFLISAGLAGLLYGLIHFLPQSLFAGGDHHGEATVNTQDHHNEIKNPVVDENTIHNCLMGGGAECKEIMDPKNKAQYGEMIAKVCVLMPMPVCNEYLGKTEKVAVKLSPTSFQAGITDTIITSFQVGNKAIDDLQIVHTKPYHWIAIRKDGGDFLHEHPTQDTQGNRILPVTFPSAGTWTVYSDISSKQYGAHVITSNVQVVGTELGFQAIPEDGYSKTIQSGNISITATWNQATTNDAWNLTRSVSGGTLQSYLGAMGHTVVTNIKSHSFLHVHPDESITDKAVFAAHFTESGIHRSFTQLLIDGKLFTVPLTIDVKGSPEKKQEVNTHNNTNHH